MHHNGLLVMTLRRYTTAVAWMVLGILLCGFPVLARGQSAASIGVETAIPQAPASESSASVQVPDQQPSGTISGTIIDPSGNVVAGARVNLTREGPLPSQEVQSDDDGHFSFAEVAPGPFKLTVTLPGFSVQTFSGTLRSGENYTVPDTTLAIATAAVEVHVVPNLTEEAQQEIREEEKQRVFGVIPNFYVTYIPNAAPLSAKQKFQLAWKTTIDPVSFGINGVIAGIQQAQNDFSGYGQGAQGYAKRYGASFADSFTGNFIGSALLPSLLKQDPRYFYKGTGTKRSRVLYAIANAFICKGDNGHWQPNYSSILGSLAAGGISNLYYPAQNRNGAELTFENALIGTAATAAANLLQEFVIRKLTPNGAGRGSTKPQNTTGRLSPSPLVQNGGLGL
jgi:Carboxypeptidase regulatory-like domain